MIYLVSRQKSLFEDSGIREISMEDSLLLMKDWKMVQFDTETTGGLN